MHRGFLLSKCYSVFIFLVCGYFTSAIASEDEIKGFFNAPLVVELLDDGRLIKLMQDFGFVDQNPRQSIIGNLIIGFVLKHMPYKEDENQFEVTQSTPATDPKPETWQVPAGTIVDGASIPRPLWSLIGSPFVGKYRKAAVIHDFFCAKRATYRHSSRAVHEIFYKAMIVSGVDKQLAGIMYYSVLRWGPRWTVERITEPGQQMNREGYTTRTLPSEPFDEVEFDRVFRLIKDQGLGKEAIENLATDKRRDD